MSEMRLNIRFHDPNSPEDTYKLVAGVFAEVCAEKLRKKLLESETGKMEQPDKNAAAAPESE